MRNLMPLLVLMLPALLQASSLSAVPATQTASANAATLLSVARAGERTVAVSMDIRSRLMGSVVRI